MTPRDLVAHRGVVLGCAMPVVLRGRRSRAMRHEIWHLAGLTARTLDDDLFPIWFAGRVAGSAVNALWWAACLVGEVILLGMTLAGVPAGASSILVLAAGATPTVVATALVTGQARRCPDRVHLDARSGDRPPGV